VISHAKIIAEPWDVGPGGWQTGNFPVGTHEWNDRFRNSVRDFWLSDAKAASHGNSGSGIRELATRLSGSADMFGHSEPPLMRGPLASINFVTAHDGFTIADLVSYDHKHNQANGEESRDGTNDNRSWNHGVEGPLAQEDMWHVIAPMRRRSMRNLLATLILSSGVPMITAGDEVGRTQLGNNNAYCQDSQISWFNWEFNRWRQQLLETTTFLLELRRLLPALRVDEFFTGKPLPHDEDHQPDLAWYNESGTRLTIEEWNNPATRTFSMFRRGRIAEGSQSSDPHVLLVFNGQLNSTTMRLPVKDNSTRTWRLAWDSEWDTPQDQPDSTPLDAGADIELEALSLQVYLADSPGLG
jgi:glycogen operon protein